MSSDALVEEVEQELFTLVQERAQDMEDVGWLVAVRDCFDGGDYDGNFEQLRWRLDVVRSRFGDENARAKPRSAYWLIEACQRVLDGERAQFRHGPNLGNLRNPASSR